MNSLNDWFDFLASLTEEQWQRVQESVRAAQQFQAGIEELQRTAGHSSEQFDEISRGLLELVEGRDEYVYRDDKLV